eukprot:CAMPEP_0168489802 /NCGR_PEP_ID=MMETSP0228-20121227/68855_1 /TAXON_ID=133427 /ORGANISM="Protoceratium reticulatum, Strain CCCM 535 (=CCMP 1889)" /LENGTH=85 /DNA_ID=CAMNT_0008506493 /DNA_START=719 /DNA_END=973 /DNA_ORIENTATION=+
MAYTGTATGTWPPRAMYAEAIARRKTRVRQGCQRSSSSVKSSQNESMLPSSSQSQLSAPGLSHGPSTSGRCRSRARRRSGAASAA